MPPVEGAQVGGRRQPRRARVDRLDDAAVDRRQMPRRSRREVGRRTAGRLARGAAEAAAGPPTVAAAGTPEAAAVAAEAAASPAAILGGAGARPGRGRRDRRERCRSGSLTGLAARAADADLASITRRAGRRGATAPARRRRRGWRPDGHEPRRDDPRMQLGQAVDRFCQQLGCACGWYQVGIGVYVEPGKRPRGSG